MYVGRASTRPASQGSINAKTPSDPIPPKQTPTAAEGRGRKLINWTFCPRLQFFRLKSPYPPSLTENCL